MKAYRQRIQEYRDFVQQTCIREEAGACTIKVCQDILTEQALQMESKKTSYFEFLYEQSRFIKKRWWVLQGGVLLYLWLWLSNNANDMKETMRLMGIFATMFVILIAPEVWKTEETVPSRWNRHRIIRFAGSVRRESCCLQQWTS